LKSIDALKKNLNALEKDAININLAQGKQFERTIKEVGYV